MQYDVIVIGAGASGLTAALNAKKNGATVAVITKTLPTHSQTVQAQGGINAVLYEDEDSVEQHLEDTYKGSYSISSKKNIEFMCKTAKDTITWLDSIGVPFNRNEKNQIAQRKFGGTKKIRTCYSSDYTGLKIVHTLYDQCIINDIKFYNEHQVLELIVSKNQCFGCIAYDIVDGKVKEFISKSTILATGGYAGIYKNHTTNSLSTTADGIAIAFNAGAVLSNMEFVQFHPTSLENTNILISESARGEGGLLLDKDKKRFIDELSTRDEISREIFKRTIKDEKVYLDLRHIKKEKLEELIPQEMKLANEFSKVDISKELLPITPAAHYSMGGIKTDINTQTSIKSLFACGECAQVDIHGANRLGGNSLLEIVTFGKVAGVNASTNTSKEPINQEAISKYINQNKLKIKSLLQRDKSNYSIHKTKNILGNKLFKKAGLFRNEETLISLTKDIEEIEATLDSIYIDDKSSIYNKNLVEYFELENSITISKALVFSAIQRKESRGSHYREDFVKSSELYKKPSILIRKNKEMQLSFEDIK